MSPKRAGWRVDPDRPVLNDADADRLDCAPHAIVIEPAVLVAEDGDDACGRVEACQLDHDVFRRNEASAEHTLNDKVAQNADQVRLRRVGAIDG